MLAWTPYAFAAATGASLIGLTVIVNVWLSLESSPPSAVPPLSESETVTVAVPYAFAALV
jgi:hypothetical protein